MGYVACVGRTKIVRASRANLAFSPLPPSPILSNTMFDKIDPRGIFSARTIPRANGVGDVVAWGPHLRVRLRRQNCEFATPRAEKPPTEHTTINSTTIHFRVPQRKTPPPITDAFPPHPTFHIDLPNTSDTTVTRVQV